jgi:hypothetical protein
MSMPHGSAPTTRSGQLANFCAVSYLGINGNAKATDPDLRQIQTGFQKVAKDFLFLPYGRQHGTLYFDRRRYNRLKIQRLEWARECCPPVPGVAPALLLMLSRWDSRGYGAI